MSNYPLEDLITRWKREELSVEQMIGQLLLVLREHDQRLRELARPPAPPTPARPPAGQQGR